MADIENKTIDELASASSIANADLFVLQQNGVAKSVSGSVVNNFVAAKVTENLPSAIQNLGADYVVAQGISGMWTYRKWNSGVAEVWGRKQHNNVSITDAWGGGYYAVLSAPDPYPSSVGFVSYPTVNLTLQASAGNGLAAWNNSTYSVTSPGNAFVYNPTEQSSVNITINYHIVGRWK